MLWNRFCAIFFVLFYHFRWINLQLQLVLLFPNGKKNNRFNNLILSIRVMMKVYILTQSHRVFTHFYFLPIQSYRFWYELKYQKFSRRVYENVCMCLIEKQKILNRIQYYVIYSFSTAVHFIAYIYMYIYILFGRDTETLKYSGEKKWKLGVCDCVCICECVYTRILSIDYSIVFHSKII